MSFAKLDLLAEVLGVISGAVISFAVINAEKYDIRVILDEEMTDNELLNFHLLVNTATTTIS